MDQAGADQDGPPQGWFVDPFGLHQHRWFSQGRPTALVRDGRAEAQDPPPDRPLPDRLVPAPVAQPPAQPSDDRLRAGDRDGHGGDAPDDAPGDQFDFFGNPVAGMSGMSPALPMSGGAGALAINPMDLTGLPTTPARVLRLRWIALAGAVVWTALVSLQFVAASTTVTTAPGHTRTESVYRSDPGGVLAFIALLVACDVVTGLGFVRRVRAGSDAWGRSGCVCAGVLGILGVLSLATVGLALLLLAFLLVAVARPLRRPRPLPGERVVPPSGR